MNKVKIPYSKVLIGEKERKYINEVLNSGWLTTASKTLEFEKEFAKTVNTKYACAVNSCTAALHLGLYALDVKPGDKVFVPTMTFTATAEVIRYMQADPVFLDVEYGSNLITPEILLNAIKVYPEVKTLIIVHYGGQSANMNEINEICKQNGIRILEDAAHSFPARFRGKMVGEFNNITCYSFYANKTITTGEGGMLVTNDEILFNKVKTMRLHGISRDIWGRFTNDTTSWEYDVIEAGFKYNMPDINAAIGLGQLEKAELFRSERQKVAEYYFANLQQNKKLDLPVINVSFDEHAWHLFPIVLNKNADIHRNDFIKLLNDEGIGTSVHYKPLHRMTYYKEKYKLNPELFPNAERTWRGNVSLPIFPFMTSAQLKFVVDTINKILD